MLDSFRLQNATDSEKISIANIDLSVPTELLKYTEESELLSAIETCADRSKKVEEVALRGAGLIVGRLDDHPRDAIRFFITMRIADNPKDSVLKMYSDGIRENLLAKTNALGLTMYRCVGNIQIIAEFWLERFQDFRSLYQVFIDSCEYLRVKDYLIQPQTYIELDSSSRFESDDGSIIGDLVKRMDDMLTPDP